MLMKNGKNRSLTLISCSTTILPEVDERVGRHALAILMRQGVKVVRQSKVISARRDTSSPSWLINLQDGATHELGLLHLYDWPIVQQQI